MRSLLIIILILSASQVASQKYDGYAYKNCEQALKTTIRRGFRYNETKPYGLINWKNWGLSWHDEVTLCSNGRECGPIKSTFDKYARRANKLIFEFMADDGFRMVCYVDQKSKAYSGRGVSALLCNPDNAYGCIPFCDLYGANTYNCRTGAEQ